jgi:hypothetical protein
VSHIHPPAGGATDVWPKQAHGPRDPSPGSPRRTRLPLAAALIVLPLVLSFDDAAAKWIAFAFGIGAAVLAVGTAWPTGIIRVIPPLLHGYADITVTVALIVLPFIVGFSGHTTALVFYLAVGAAGLAATVATRFEPQARTERSMPLGMAA